MSYSVTVDVESLPVEEIEDIDGDVSVFVSVDDDALQPCPQCGKKWVLVDETPTEPCVDCLTKSKKIVS